jgi:hypothetical protein
VEQDSAGDGILSPGCIGFAHNRPVGSKAQSKQWCARMFAAVEIGIRMAFGAGRRDVVKMIIGHGMTLTSAGVVIGRWHPSHLHG